MQPPPQCSRNNLDELKGQIMKKLGPEGPKQYFYYLQRFLCLQLSKVEFDKLCLRILGRENIPLHNQLIRSILKNACCAKSPPPTSHKDDASKDGAHVSQPTHSDGYQQNGWHTGTVHTSGSNGLSNGGYLVPVSPRKPRSGSRDKRGRDRQSALVPNGKTCFPQLSTATQPMLEDGVLNPSDSSGRPVQQVDDGREKLVSLPPKKPVVRRSPDGPSVVYSKEKMELVDRNDREDTFYKSPLQAPLGVPFSPVSIGGACRVLPTASSIRYICTLDDGNLLDNHSLRDRMEHIAAAQGLDGVSMDSANILNHGLDSYIKGLLMSCIELMGARSGHELTTNNAHKNHASLKLVNGVIPGHQFHMTNSSTHRCEMPNNVAHQYQIQEHKVIPPISLQDFRVAMELNPRQLGEDWPLLLEKICTHAFEE